MYQSSSFSTFHCAKDNRISSTQTNGLPQSCYSPKVFSASLNDQRKLCSSIPSQPFNSVLMSICVEGTKTGEEKITPSTDRRRSSSAALKPLYKKPLNQISAKNSHIIQSTKKDEDDDVTKVRDLLKVKIKENNCTKKKKEELEERLKESHMISAECEKTYERKLCEKDNRIADLEAQIVSLKGNLKKVEHQLVNSAVEMKSQKVCLERELDKVRKQLADKEEQNACIETTNAKYLKAIEELEASLEEAKSLLSKQCICSCDDLLASIDEYAKWEEIALDAQRELRDNASYCSEWKDKVDRCHDYIVSICQPQFSVVKDITLAPVEPRASIDGSAQVGFVLVPLELMIEGYDLLPTETKNHITETYEASKSTALKDRIISGRYSFLKILNDASTAPSKLSITTMSTYNLKNNIRDLV